MVSVDFLLHDALCIARSGIVTLAVDSRRDHPDGVDIDGTTDQYQLITRLKLRAACRYDNIPLSLDGRDDDAHGQPCVVEGSPRQRGVLTDENSVGPCRIPLTVHVLEAGKKAQPVSPHNIGRGDGPDHFPLRSRGPAPSGRSMW